MRVHALIVAGTIAATLALSSLHPRATTRPGITPVSCPQQEWQYADPTFAALAGAKAFSGRYDGGLYEIEIPDRWNGELVLYAHGYVPNAGQNGSNLRVGRHPIRDHLIEQGFAWAASSYRCNGYVPGQGLVDTMALVDLFTKSNGGKAPQRTYLTGTSMGGHVTILGLHQFPTSFAGGLAMCPAGPELFDFYAGVGAAAETITGVQFRAGALQEDAARMAEVLGKPPDLTEKGRQLASVEIGISGGPRPFAVEGLAAGGRFLANISGAALAGVDSPQNRAVSTTEIKYVGALNERVRRKSGDPVYRSDRTPYDEVAPFDGKIERPLLTMHGTGDLFVPIFLERRLKAAVDAAGKSSLLAQRIYRIAGHCGFSPAEQIQSFDDLVKWVRAGAKPSGDNVDADLRDAGRAFTSPLRDGDPGHLDEAAATQAARDPNVRVDFVRDVQPIFRQHCYGCHGPTVHQNGFRLDRRADAFRGGTGPVIGRDTATSRLYMRIAGIRGFGGPMPPTGPLDAGQIDIIKRWIDEGAEWPDAVAGDSPPRPTPPLMRAVLDRDRPAIQRLLDEHADVNAANDAGATALMWATMNLDAPTVSALIARGANVNARSDDGRTALLIASRLHGALPIVTMLLDRGADPSVKAAGFGGDTNPLTEAAWAGELDTIRALVAKGADTKAAGFVALAFTLHANCRACFDLLVPTMDKQAITYAPLVLTAPVDDGRMIVPLIDRGADVGVVDGAGRSLLMRLVASDTVPADVVETVIAHGADVNYTNPKDGASALSFAALRGDTPVVDMLLKAGAHGPREPAVGSAPNRPLAALASARDAVERSAPLLQESDVTFMRKTGCVSCHNNSLTAMAMSVARSHGVRVDEEIAQSQVDAIATFLDGWRERALQNIGIPGENDTISSILLGLSAEGFPRNATTDAVAQFMLRQQMPDGRWIITAHRPPIESSDIQVTANCIRALQVYAPPAQRAEYDAAIRRAADWLRRAAPRSTEDRAYQLLGYGWTRATKTTLQASAKALIAQQRADGGWSQLSTLPSDAYATGEALVALEESGAMTVADPAYRKGVAFLLKTQLADGSWYVPSRAIAIQPYFESGFPHGRDQFISAAATGWAVMALAATIH